MMTEGVYANIFIPVDLRRSPRYRETEFGRGLVEAMGGWEAGALPTLSEAETPAEPFMYKLKNDVPISLKALTGFVDYDDSEYLQKLEEAGDSTSLRILEEWHERESKKIDIRLGERFHKIFPRGVTFGIHGINIYALEYFLNYDGISVIVLHLVCTDTKTNLERLENTANLHTTPISEWLTQCFDGLAMDVMDLFPPGMNSGLGIALAEGEEEIIDISSHMIMRRRPLRNEDVWDLRSKYVFLGILLTIQKAALCDLRAHWPIFNKTTPEEVTKRRDSLFSFLNTYWWIKISDNKAFTALYDAWHKENKTQEQINQLVSEIQLHWQERENENSRSSSERIEKIAEWGSVAAILALVPTWESLLLGHLSFKAGILSIVLTLAISGGGLLVYRRLRK